MISTRAELTSIHATPPESIAGRAAVTSCTLISACSSAGGGVRVAGAPRYDGAVKIPQSGAVM